MARGFSDLSLFTTQCKALTCHLVAQEVGEWKKGAKRVGLWLTSSPALPRQTLREDVSVSWQDSLRGVLEGGKVRERFSNRS
jgi:hypothetical protein